MASCRDGDVGDEEGFAVSPIFGRIAFDFRDVTLERGCQIVPEPLHKLSTNLTRRPAAARQEQLQANDQVRRQAQHVLAADETESELDKILREA